MTDNPELPVEMTEEKRTKNTLTLTNQLKLARWCDDHTACSTEPYTKLAAMAAAELGFTVTASNMSSTIDACGIERRKPDAPPSVEEQIKALEQQVVNLGVLHADMLTSMRLMTQRLERLERLQDDRADRIDGADRHPELPNLPVPAFGETGGTAGLPFDADVRESVGPPFGM